MSTNVLGVWKAQCTVAERRFFLEAASRSRDPKLRARFSLNESPIPVHSTRVVVRKASRHPFDLSRVGICGFLYACRRHHGGLR